MLNEIFDAVFCINLDRRPDRLERFTAMAKELHFTFTRWQAVDSKVLKHPNGMIMEENERRNNELACKLSHLRLLKYAKEKKYSSILIFEDDAVINQSLIPILDSITSLTKDYDEPRDFKFELYQSGIKIQHWHMLYLGVNDINKTKEKITENIYRIYTGFTTHAYAVNSIAYDILIEALEYRGQADVLYADYVHPLGKSYCIHPNIVYQEDGFSDITEKEESYQQLK